MRLQMIRTGLAVFALLAGASPVVATELPVLPDSVADAMAQASPQAMEEYRRKLKEWEEAQAPFEAYWNSGMQSGYRGPGTRPISTAIGYNQRLTTNSVELMAGQGDALLKALRDKAATLSGAPRKAMEDKIAVMKKMVAFAQSVPDTWSDHEKLANTDKGWALHAMVLDIDVGPHLQTHKLLTSVLFARAKGYMKPLSAAELEMMNLTGDGTGLDMVTMPHAMRQQVPTSNFFQRGGYERNPVAVRHNTVAKLLAVTDERMDFNSSKPGAQELAAAF